MGTSKTVQKVPNKIKVAGAVYQKLPSKIKVGNKEKGFKIYELDIEATTARLNKIAEAKKAAKTAKTIAVSASPEKTKTETSAKK